MDLVIQLMEIMIRIIGIVPNPYRPVGSAQHTLGINTHVVTG